MWYSPISVTLYVVENRLGNPCAVKPRCTSMAMMISTQAQQAGICWRN